ncbi:MAG: hypothetical protein WAV20_25870, partial [Blastocatellia bacterium]
GTGLLPRAKLFGTEGGEAAQSKGIRSPESKALQHRGRQSRSDEGHSFPRAKLFGTGGGVAALTKGMRSREQSSSAQRAAKPLSPPDHSPPFK